MVCNFSCYGSNQLHFYAVGQCLYSARLYRNVHHKGEISAIFCVCLLAPIYTKVVIATKLAGPSNLSSHFLQHCDQVIMNEYTGMSAKGEGRSQVYAQIVGDVVRVHPSEAARLSVSFDKKPTQVRQ